ncbi:DUF2398 family protein [Spiractinospora alimapuensis]|uniref:DUF2398 family protein n=1 Tax=Spiractinospora alimapuensis TaxID=2820884 RepID=UPI001F3762F7|nr:DUF2398 family protein [Spiractinospora alimapuensis]QVQ51014.1 DUF2398 family protein [Spiractinospora alimapuensis]
MGEGRGGDIALTVERQAAARVLLVNPLVRAATSPEDFAGITTHADWLIQRFTGLLGYSLTVEAQFARLHKGAPIGVEPSGLRQRSGSPFTPRGYAYLTVALAVLGTGPATVSLADLLSEVRATAIEAGVRVGPAERLAERRPLAAALVQLAQWGVLSAEATTPADIGSRVERGAERSHDLELQVDHDVLRAIPGPAVEEPAATAAPDEDPAEQERTIELAVRRRLVEQAVVYRDELTERHREWLARNQWRTIAQLGDFLGCDGEIRAEGVALVGVSDGRATGFPAVPLDRPAVRLVSRIAEELRPNRTARATPIPDDLLDRALATIPEQGSRTVALERLAEFGLIERRDPEDTPEWSLLAAAARFTPHPAENPAEPTADPDTTQ